MNDYKLESRKQNYRKCNSSILESREQFNLSLRKKQINEFISSKRKYNKKFDNATEINSELEIDIQKLKVDSKYLPNGILDFENDSKDILNMLQSQSPDYIKFAVHHLKNFFLNLDPTESYLIVNKIIDVVKSSGILTELVQIIFTKLDDNPLIFETLWTLTNITAISSFDHSYLDIFATDEALEIFFTHYHSKFIDIQDQITWLACHLISDNIKCRDKFLDSKFTGEVYKLLRKDQMPLEMLRESLRYLSNLFKRTETTPPEYKLIEGLNIFSGYLYAEDTEAIFLCINGIFNISEFESSYASLHRQIINSGSIVKIMNLDFMKNHLGIMYSVRLLGNLLTGKHEIVDELLGLKILDLFDGLCHSFPQIRVNIVWATSNIAAGGFKHVCILIDSQLFSKIVFYLSDNNYSLKREAVWVINNCASICIFEINQQLVNKGVLQALVTILEVNTQEGLLQQTLESIKCILYSGECLKGIQSNNEVMTNPFLREFEKIGGIDVLEKLQGHKNSEIYNAVSHILINFFSIEDVHLF